MNRKEIEQKYAADGGLKNLVMNNPVKFKKYATKEATSKNLSRTLKNMSSFGPNFTDTNFAIVDARDAMQKVIDIADKAGYGAVKTVAKKLTSKKELSQYYRFLLVAEGMDGKMIRPSGGSYYKKYEDALKAAKALEKPTTHHLLIEGELANYPSMGMKPLYTWRNPKAK